MDGSKVNIKSDNGSKHKDVGVFKMFSAAFGYWQDVGDM